MLELASIKNQNSGVESIAIRCISCFEAAISLFNDFKLGRRRSESLLDALNHLLDTVAEDLKSFAGSGNSSCCVIVDGLDECNERVNLLGRLKALTWDRIKVKVFVTSRPEKEIERLIHHSRLSGVTYHHITMDSEIVDLDISRYVEFRLKNDEKFRSLTDNMRTEIQQKLLVKSGGM